MNFVALIALIPKIMQAIALINTIKTALASGQNILEVLKEKGAEFIQFFSDVAKVLFPGLNQEQQVAAGVLMFDVQAVQEIQGSMNTLMNAGLQVDGSYGPLTKAAVSAFQTKHGLTVDGWAGRLTNAIIQVELAKRTAPAEMASALATVPK